MKIHAFGVFRTRKEKCFVLLEKTAPFSACSSSVFALAYLTHARSLRGWLSRLEQHVDLRYVSLKRDTLFWNLKDWFPRLAPCKWYRRTERAHAPRRTQNRTVSCHCLLQVRVAISVSIVSAALRSFLFHFFLGLPGGGGGVHLSVVG